MSKQMKTVDIARDFSREPVGRYRGDGDYSGEAFREDLLFPALKSFDRVTVVLDGTEGYGSSFLEEAFGGLVRDHDFPSQELEERLSLVCSEDATVIEEILGYIRQAEGRKGTVSRANS